MARRKFTQGWLDGKIEPGEYQDRGCDGLYLRAGKKSKTWVHRYFCKLNEPYRRKTKIGKYPSMPWSEARGIVQTQRRLVDKGIDPEQADEIEEIEQTDEADEKPDKSFRTISKKVLNQLEKDAKADITVIPQMVTINDYKEKRRNHCEPIYKLDMDEATPGDIADLLNKIDKMPTRKAVRKTVSAMFKYAMKYGYIDRMWNPVKVVGTTKHAEVDEEVRPGQTRIPHDVIAEIWFRTAAMPHAVTRTVIRMGLLTGMRRHSIVTMEWHQMHGLEIKIPQNKFKGRRKFILPVSRQLNRVMELYREEWERFAEWRQTSYVFPTSKKDALVPHFRGDSFYNAMKSAQGGNRKTKGGEFFSPHALRKTIETELADLDAPYKIGKRVLGHKFKQLDEAYDHLDYTQKKDDWFQVFGHHIATIIRKFKSDHPDKVIAIRDKLLNDNRRANKHSRLPEERLVARWERHSSI